MKILVVWICCLNLDHTFNISGCPHNSFMSQVCQHYGKLIVSFKEMKPMNKSKHTCNQQTHQSTLAPLRLPFSRVCSVGCSWICTVMRFKSACSFTCHSCLQLELVRPVPTTPNQTHPVNRWCYRNLLSHISRCSIEVSLKCSALFEFLHHLVLLSCSADHAEISTLGLPLARKESNTLTKIYKWIEFLSVF